MMKKWYIAIIALMLGVSACTQQSFETLLTVPISEFGAGASAYTISSELKKYLEKNDMTCEAYGGAPGLSCHEKSGRDLLSTIRVNFEGEVSVFRVWTLAVVFKIDDKNKVHDNTERLLRNFLGEPRWQSVHRYVDGREVGP